MRLGYSHYAKNDLQLAELMCYAYDGAGEEKFEHDGSEVALFENANDRVIAFLGTNERKDWMYNLDCRKNGVMHSGFYDAYSKVAMQVFQWIKGGNDKRNWVVGHSLGGGMCTAFAMTADHIYPGNEKINYERFVCFGSPRCVDPSMASHFHRHSGFTVYHYRHGMDPVPELVPSRIGLTEYDHLAPKKNREWLNKPTRTAGLLEILKDPKQIVEHHAMKQYKMQLKKFVRSK